MKLELRIVGTAEVKVSLHDSPRLLITHGLATSLLPLVGLDYTTSPQSGNRARFGHRVLLGQFIVLDSLIHLKRGGSLRLRGSSHV